MCEGKIYCPEKKPNTAETHIHNIRKRKEKENLLREIE